MSTERSGRIREKGKKRFSTAVDLIIDDYRQTYGRSPKRHEIYEHYKAAMDMRMFSDDRPDAKHCFPKSQTITARAS